MFIFTLRKVGSETCWFNAKLAFKREAASR